MYGLIIFFIILVLWFGVQAIFDYLKKTPVCPHCKGTGLQIPIDLEGHDVPHTPPEPCFYCNGKT